MPTVTSASADQLAKNIEEYLVEHPAAALLEDGRVLLDMRIVHYAVSESQAQHRRKSLNSPSRIRSNWSRKAQRSPEQELGRTLQDRQAVRPLFSGPCPTQT